MTSFLQPHTWLDVPSLKERADELDECFELHFPDSETETEQSQPSEGKENIGSDNSFSIVDFADQGTSLDSFIDDK